MPTAQSFGNLTLSVRVNSHRPSRARPESQKDEACNNLIPSPLKAIPAPAAACPFLRTPAAANPRSGQCPYEPRDGARQLGQRRAVRAGHDAGLGATAGRGRATLLSFSCQGRPGTWEVCDRTSKVQDH